MQCPNCGSELNDGWKFCPKCTKPLPGAMVMKICPNCGNPKNQEEFLFCSKCGCSLEVATENISTVTPEVIADKKSPYPPKVQSSAWKLAIAAVFIGIVVLAIIPKGSEQKSTQNAAAISAFQQVESLYRNMDFIKAKQAFKQMEQQYPNAPETQKAREILVDIEKLANQQEEKNKQVEERKAKEAAEKKARQSDAINYMRTSHDDVEGITWYHDKSTTRYNNENDFFVYFGKKQTGSPWLRFRIQYADESWLFIKRYTIKADDKTFSIDVKHRDVVRDVIRGGGIAEWLDVSFDEHKKRIVETVIASNKAVIRFEGEKYYKDRTITAEEKVALQHVLDAYEALGGTL